MKSASPLGTRGLQIGFRAMACGAGRRVPLAGRPQLHKRSDRVMLGAGNETASSDFSFAIAISKVSVEYANLEHYYSGWRSA